jgi:hypothetical protein
MKLARCTALALAAIGLVAINGCTPIWSQGHPYTESSVGLDPHALETSVEERNAQKKAWDDENARQSAQRLQTYK